VKHSFQDILIDFNPVNSNTSKQLETCCERIISAEYKHHQTACFCIWQKYLNFISLKKTFLNLI